MNRSRVPPPAASTVYELTALGEAMRPLADELTRWGLRFLGAPRPGKPLQLGRLLGCAPIEGNRLVTPTSPRSRRHRAHWLRLAATVLAACRAALGLMASPAVAAPARAAAGHEPDLHLLRVRTRCG
ncbi:hypothetical protein ABZ543_32015 [Streptomyces roseifaciens]